MGPVYPYKGGISQFTSRLAEELAKTDDVLVVSWSRQYPGLLYPGGEQRLRDAPALHVRVAPALDYRNPVSWLRAARLLRRWRPDWVLVTWATTFQAPIYLVLLALLRTARPRPAVGAICHNVLPHEQRPFDRLLTSAVLDRMRVAVVHAKSELATLRAVARRPQGIALFMPQLHDIPGALIAHEPPIRPVARRVLFFGHVRPYKGLRYLLEAWRLVLHELDAHLMVVGEFWERREEYLDLIEQGGIRANVTVVDRYVPDADVAHYFETCDVVVLPYVDATQSAIVPIAFAFGRPVITTHVGGIPEAVRDGETGLIVPPRDAPALARAIVQFYRDGLAERLTRNVGRERDRLSWPRYAQGLREALKREP